MPFLRRLRRRQRRVVVVGLDGTPYSFLQEALRAGRLPNLGHLVKEGSLLRMTSVYPWVSSVAWATFMTGVNPAKHGIFGFIDRDPRTYRTFIPVASHMRAPTLWERLSQAGKRVLVMNVPVTFPPKPVNGVLVAGFLSPSVEKAVFPPDVASTLKGLGYRVDADPRLARQSLEAMMETIQEALERRLAAFWHFWEQEAWDFAMLVIMETDRLHHFYWAHMEADHPRWAPAFFEVYERIDAFIGRLAERLDDRTSLMLLSDHGFCSIKQEVYYNHWLHQAGYLRYREMRQASAREMFSVMAPSSRAYSMDPGRVFIHLKGRERDGSVAPEEYERLREEVIEAAECLELPETGEKPVLKAYRREELYHGPYLEQAADIILAPANGYDPKGAIYKDVLARRDPVMVGMHTYDDAFVYVRGARVARAEANILDVKPTVLDLLNLDVPAELDGTSLLR
ncbi:MAG: alkaline phosphatase family protein [Ardenticatenia bacterium]|nr:alkaline phosphatase family protein [Ardenticatenia bacterium]